MLSLKLDGQGLIAAVAQDRLSGEVRMVAWMNSEALKRTLETGLATFYSRSRQALWQKGESSGNALRVLSAYIDCDADTVLLLVDPMGPTCHTGAPTCFFRKLTRGGDVEAEGAAAGPFLSALETELAERAQSSAEKSYTRSLLDGGAAKIGAKLREEADEVARALASESDERVANEAADVLYHLLVGLRLREVPLKRVIGVLADRAGVSGHVEKARRVASTEPT